MDLFTTSDTPNILPYDGEVISYGKICNDKACEDYFNTLLENIVWNHDETVLFGKRIVTQRKVAFYGDQTYSYKYSNTTKTAYLWTDVLLQLKTLVEQKTGETYNSCLLNLYHNGNEGMGWHSDAEKEMKEDGAIASLSFGAERKFVFKHKETKQTISTILLNGSLLVMKGSTQKHWLHSLPKSKKITTPRINLTFRTLLINP